jgi:DNA-binding FrmR family transcriptional regulator
MKIQSAATKDELNKRLRRIEGQMRGIQKMLDEDRDCGEIVQQLTAAQSALRSATTVFMNTHARECLLRSADADTPDRLALVDELFNLLAVTR